MEDDDDDSSLLGFGFNSWCSIFSMASDSRRGEVRAARVTLSDPRKRLPGLRAIRSG